MFNWLFKQKSLSDHLNETKKVKIQGITFTIKKINTFDYLDGSKAVKQVFDTYQVAKNDQNLITSDKKIKEHFSHVICAGVLNPKIYLKEKGQGDLIEGTYVGDLFVDWDLVTLLYTEIMNFTYGKKKTKLNILAKKN